ncbi:hypothetical protein Ndes2526B_g05344 [Nannochloris sp. 'desiccata']
MAETRITYGFLRWLNRMCIRKSAVLDYLPKLLLQHDESPFLNDLNLIKACESEKLVYCVHPRGLDIAVALGQRLVLFRASTISPSSPAHTTDPPHFITPTQAPESISSIACLWSASTNDSCLAVGTSAGFLQLHSFPEGTLLHRQELGDTAVLSIIVRWSGSGLDPQDSAEEITIGFENSVVRIPSYDIWPAVRWHVRAIQHQQANNSNIGKNADGSTSVGTSTSTTWWGGGGTGIGSIVNSAGGGHHAPQITPTKYYFKKSMGPRTAAACVGPAAPLLSSLLARRQDPPHRNVIFTVGSDPPFASFIVEESQSGGSILSLVAGLATSSASQLFGRAKSFLPGSGGSSSSGVRGSGKVNTSSRPSTPTPTPLGGGGGGSVTTINSNSLAPQAIHMTTADTSNLKKREKMPGITVYQESAIWDEAKRKVTQMALSPCCRWATCCDSLGRVLLIDVASCIVLKMLKGYREAQAVWFIPSERNKESTTTATALLVVYAPRRGVVEMWTPHSGVRVGRISAAVPQKGVLVEQPAVPTSLVNSQKRNSQISSSLNQYHSWRSFQSNSCWMLDLESLVLVDLTEKLNQLIVNSSS